MPVTDRLGLQLAAAQPVRIQESFQGASNEQGRAVECRRLIMGIHDRGQASIVNCQ